MKQHLVEYQFVICGDFSDITCTALRSGFQPKCSPPILASTKSGGSFLNLNQHLYS